MNNNNETETTTMDDYTFTVCQDCAGVIANGESGHMDRFTADYEEWSEAHDDGMTQWSWVALGRLHGVDHCGTDHGHDDDDVTECETVTFSGSPCGICGTTLGGFRFHAMAERASA